jgi:hypothetical protein
MHINALPVLLAVAVAIGLESVPTFAQTAEVTEGMYVWTQHLEARHQSTPHTSSQHLVVAAPSNA